MDPTKTIVADPPTTTETKPNHPLTAFISGPLEISTSYFKKYYTPRILTAIESNHNFIIGPVSGSDALALEYLLSQNISPSRIKIYMAGFELASRPKVVQELEEKGVKVFEVEYAETTWDRDAAMTRDSDYDILRFRTEMEQKAIFGGRWRARVSNTERNARRRKGEGGMEGREIKYVRHVSAVERMVKLWGRNSGEDGDEECDGMCDAHRDVVVWPLVLGRGAFGFGSDGGRMY